MTEQLKKLYGSYIIPQDVIQLIELEKTLTKGRLSLDMIGLIPIKEDYNYFITPPDLIPFASTGGNGTHFGFLTDFGKHLDLNDAPIVCVSPTNDPPLRYIARNLKDFLQLVYSVPHTELLESAWGYESNKQLEDEISEFSSYSNRKLDKKRNKIRKLFQKTFNPTIVEDVVRYIRKVNEERKSVICIETLDGLGIHRLEQSKTVSTLPEHIWENTKQLESYLDQASKEEQLAFVRDAHYRYVLAPGYDEQIKELVIKVLNSFGMTSEALRVMERV